MLQQQKRIRDKLFGARLSEELLQPKPVVVFDSPELPNCKAVHLVDLAVVAQPLLLRRRGFFVGPGGCFAPPTGIHAPRGTRSTNALSSWPPCPDLNASTASDLTSSEDTAAPFSSRRCLAI